MKRLSHVDSEGRAAMVDVDGKPPLRRRAVAEGRIRLAPATLTLISRNEIQKGDVLAAAEIAGVQAAKRTFELIPLCHVLQIGRVEVRATVTQGGVVVRSEVVYTGKTGVEMEALTAVSVALLTVYDMCKAVDGGMIIESIRLVTKEKSEA